MTFCKAFRCISENHPQKNRILFNAFCIQPEISLLMSANKTERNHSHYPISGKRTAAFPFHRQAAVASETASRICSFCRPNGVNSRQMAVIVVLYSLFQHKILKKCNHPYRISHLIIYICNRKPKIPYFLSIQTYR